MLKFIALVVLAAWGLFALNVYRRLRKHIAQAKSTGLPYVIVPWHPTGPAWFLLNDIVIQTLAKFEYTSRWNWVRVLNRQGSWKFLRETEEKYGDTFLTVSPVQVWLKTSNAEPGAQITGRRNDFVKQVDLYKIADIYGKNILTTEGQEWKRHKKVIAPSFSEKSNRLVFEESLRQAESMMNYWISQGSNTSKDIKVEDAPRASSTLSFHVICAAGFGVPLLWPGETEDKLQGNGIPGFSYMLPGSRHAMPLKEALGGLLKRIFWFAAFDLWHLKKYPWKKMNEIYMYWSECSSYFNELLELRKKELYLGESEKGTMDLLGPMIKASEEAPLDLKPSDPNGARLSKEEIIGNSFIFMFAGHETSANSIHYSILQLAISLSDQRRMQTDIDSIVGSKPISDWSYQRDMPRLYNSMVGAVLNEELRIIPAIPSIGKSSNGNHLVHMDGREFIIPNGTRVQMNVIGTNRNPRYWPNVPSKISGKPHDLDDFVPERWLPANRSKASEEKPDSEAAPIDGLETASYETSSSTSLLKPPKGAFMPFSEGARACPGRRFAQVEITAVLASIFQRYSVELDVSRWASDEAVSQMSEAERRGVYATAVGNAREVVGRSEQMTTIQLRKGDKLPIRFVERGMERFV